MNDTVTAAEMRLSVNELRSEFDDVRRRADRMTGRLRLAAREAPDNLTKAAIASEERAHERFLGSLGRVRHVLTQIDLDLAKLEGEAGKGHGYSMPEIPAAHPIARLSFMKASPREVRRGVPFARAAASRAVAQYASGIHEALRATGASVAEEIRRADMTKAAVGKVDLSIVSDLLPAVALLTLPVIAGIASRIARALNLGGLLGLASNKTPGVFAADVVGEALASLDLDIAPGVAEQIESTASAAATQRAHELVGLRQEHGGPVVDPGAQRSIVDTTRNMVEAAIVADLQDGKDAGAIADAIEGLDAFSPERAALIAETELRTVNAASQLMAWSGASDASGVPIKKRWVTDPASKVCDICFSNERLGPVPLDATFPSGDANPPNHPRCKCWIEPVFSAASVKAFNPPKRTLH